MGCFVPVGPLSVLFLALGGPKICIRVPGRVRPPSCVVLSCQRPFSARVGSKTEEALCSGDQAKPSLIGSNHVLALPVLDFPEKS